MDYHNYDSDVGLGLLIVGFVFFVVPVILRKTILKPAECRSKRKLNGMIAIVTGSNTGLGKETALDLAKRGAKVYMACRDSVKTAKAIQDIHREVPGAELVELKLDLSSLTSIRSCCEEFLKLEKQLDIFVACAGFGAFHHRLTEDKIEWHLGINHLGHFFMMRMLMALLNKSGAPDQKSRIVTVSSKAHEVFVKSIDYDGLQRGDFFARSLAYGQSKLANLLCTKYLSKLLTDKNVTVNAVHPGTCSTDFFRYYLPLPSAINSFMGVIFFPFAHMIRTPREGAQTLIYAAVDEEIEGVSGKYLVDCAFATPSIYAQDDEEAEKLWQWSCSKTRLPLEI